MTRAAPAWWPSPISTSHEVIEAATDPFPRTAPAFHTPASSHSGWAAVGGELADLCSEPSLYTMEGGFGFQRVWSNRVAIGRMNDPCVPAPPSSPYYGVTFSPESYRSVSPGEIVTFTVTGFSFVPVADWAVLVTPPLGAPAPTATLDATTMNDGTTATLTIHVPASAPRGWWSLMFVACNLPRAAYHDFPVALYVP